MLQCRSRYLQGWIDQKLELLHFLLENLKLPTMVNQVDFLLNHFALEVIIIQVLKGFIVVITAVMVNSPITVIVAPLVHLQQHL